MVPNPDAEQWGPHQLLSMAARLVQRRQDQALAELGLTHAAVIALQGLTDGPLNQEQLAADIKVRSQSLGRVLARLEGAGLVARESSSLDRRHNQVSITEDGRQALEAARKAEQDALPPDVVEGTVLGRELARVISYFPGRSKAGSAKNQNAAAGVGDPTMDEAAEAGTPVASAPAEGAPTEGAPAEGAPTEGARPTEGAQKASGTGTSAEPALRASASEADGAGQDAIPAPEDGAGTGQKPKGVGDSSTE
ncbi:putative MarR family transcriptional regulator [Arthrobacter globiformis NBRC 12137]|uniref:Putative MarR family transcriptional regulator n=1 Tax=Arthrobacter globiformis (strain ATCC 8010 / DSM 20124 / JCM 1332 / NBRC 12137 / NCIMB 8907 / NRRL B-2979 / 168) TaxID=1077972 RepID=H0QNH9_ARTG1|nr:MarR family transcriptional regulator [Arthrobacter globiformis]GAB14380.1 putative MarR family transcriptional regulator [Arthrobacter globiformis NBRC 12137]